MIRHSETVFPSAFVAFALVWVYSSAALAVEPWDGEPLTGDPKAILKAANSRTVSPAGGMEFLHSRHHVRFDAERAHRTTSYLIYRVVDDQLSQPLTHVTR